MLGGVELLLEAELVIDLIFRGSANVGFVVFSVGEDIVSFAVVIDLRDMILRLCREQGDLIRFDRSDDFEAGSHGKVFLIFEICRATHRKADKRHGGEYSEFDENVLHGC